jgi:hypothetical protein
MTLPTSTSNFGASSEPVIVSGTTTSPLALRRRLSSCRLPTPAATRSAETIARPQSQRSIEADLAAQNGLRRRHSAANPKLRGRTRAARTAADRRREVRDLAWRGKGQIYSPGIRSGHEDPHPRRERSEGNIMKILTAMWASIILATFVQGQTPNVITSCEGLSSLALANTTMTSAHEVPAGKFADVGVYPAPTSRSKCGCRPRDGMASSWLSATVGGQDLSTITG